MWFMIIALVSFVASLVFGRLLARARIEQTNPLMCHGPSIGAPYPAHRDAVAESVRRRHLVGAEVHLN